jgi:hypothetical protein
MAEDPIAKLEENEDLSPQFILRAAAERLQTSAQAMQIGIDRARHYAQNEKREGYFIGLANLRIADLSDEARIQTLTDLGFSVSVVDNAPNVVHLASALIPELQSQYALIGHLAKLVRHELFVSDQLATNWQSALNIAHRAVYALRIRTGNLCIAIGASRTPWNQMAGESASLHILLLDNPGISRWSDEDASVGLADLEWFLFAAPRIFDLYELPAFRLAFDAAGESPFLGDIRTSIARVWAGIEALFDVQQELSYRLSMYAAVLIADTVDERLEVAKRFRSLYTKRSKAVHGSPMSSSELKKTAYASWRLLCELVDACIRTGNEIVPPKGLDRVLLGETLSRRDPKSS